MVPITRSLVHRLEAIFSLAGNDRIDADLVPSWMIRTASGDPERGLDEDDTLFVRDFLAYRLLEEDLHHLSPERKAFYRAMLATFDGSDPNPPDTSHRVAILRQSGTVSAEWALHYETRPRFAGTGWGDAPSQEESAPALAHVVEVGGVLLEGASGMGVNQGILWLVEAGHAERHQRLPVAMMIGAYGGDHIGDAAILGGVLFRIHAAWHQPCGSDESASRPYPPSIRMLDTPVEVTVEEYSQDNAARLFAVCRRRCLCRRTANGSSQTASEAPLHGVSGAAVREALHDRGHWSGSVHTRHFEVDSAPIMRRLHTTARQDPAFDCLATRGKKLTRLRANDGTWIESLLANTEGRIRIGLNMRPITAPLHHWNVHSQYTRFVEARFEERLAEAMRRFHKALPSLPCFIFFPMNAVQFGLSDLRSAYRIKLLIGGEVDFRVWKTMPSIDGVIALIRQLDVAITMRLCDDLRPVPKPACDWRGLPRRHQG
jgi:hypothetical protein